MTQGGQTISVIFCTSVCCVKSSKSCQRFHKTKTAAQINKELVKRTEFEGAFGKKEEKKTKKKPLIN